MSNELFLLRGACEKVLNLVESETDLVSQTEFFTSAMKQGLQYLKGEEAVDKSPKQSLIEFEWGIELKQYCILLRDLIFRSYKGQFKPTSALNSKDASAVLKTATSSLLSSLEAIVDADELSLDSKAEQWKHQLSPLPHLENQINTLIHQVDEMPKASSHLKEVERDLLFYKTELDSTFGAYQEILGSVLLQLEELTSEIDTVKAKKDTASLHAAISSIDDLYNQIDDYRSDNEINELAFSARDMKTIPVSLQEGNLVTKQIDFSKQINTWVESEIFPEILQFDKDLKQKEYGFLVSLVNLKNRLSLFQSNPELMQTPAIDNLESSVLTIKSEINSIQQELVETQHTHKEKIAQNLGIDRVFADDQFYLVPQSRVILSDYQREGNRWIQSIPVKRVRRWLSNAFDQYIVGGEDVGTLRKNNARLIQYVRAKSLNEIDQFSHSLFLSKGYLGSTFYTIRKDFSRVLSVAMEAWNEGFGSSLLVYGRKLSGKSAILESLIHSLPNFQVIELTSDESIQYLGQHITISYDLPGALKQIEKLHDGNPCVIVIDDLQQWKSSETAFTDNVRGLLSQMYKNSKKFLFIVGVNNAIKAELDSLLQFTPHFSHTYDTSSADQETIKEIIKTRENALGYTTSSDDSEFEQLLNKTISRHRNNIGASLLEWTRSKHQKEEENVVEIDQFKIFFNKHRSVLDYVLKWGSISEKEISEFKNPSLIVIMSESIRTLLSYRILERQLGGKLYIPVSLIDDVEHVLDSVSPLNPHTYA